MCDDLCQDSWRTLVARAARRLGLRILSSELLLRSIVVPRPRGAPVQCVTYIAVVAHGTEVNEAGAGSENDLLGTEVLGFVREWRKERLQDSKFAEVVAFPKPDPKSLCLASP
jgi:hypothetical protein